VIAMRLSYVGELDWEIYTSAENGLRLWDALWAAGQSLGVIAAGRAAFNSLRLEKGYRAWGTDMTRQHGPEESGLAFTLRRTDTTFLGAEALAARPTAARVLRCLVLEDEQVAMGAEPVLVDGEAVGFVTSAGWGASVGRSIALAWLPRSLATGDVVAIAYFDRMLPAQVADEPLFDPSGERLRA